jgi:hypothetical protein
MLMAFITFMFFSLIWNAPLLAIFLAVCVYINEKNNKKCKCK